MLENLFQMFDNAISSVFRIILVIVIVIVVIGVVVLIYDSYQKQQHKEEQKRKEIAEENRLKEYVNNLSYKYRNLSLNEKVDIYNNYLLEIQKWSQSAEQKYNKGFKVNSEVQSDLLANAMANSWLVDDYIKQVKNKYKITIVKEYVDYDIDYIYKEYCKYNK